MITHITIYLSLAYLFGAAMHTLLRADYAFKSKVNPFASRRAWFVFYWPTVVVRVGFWGYMTFLTWLNHPDLVAKLATTFNVPGFIAGWLIVTPTLLACAGAGFLIDIGWDYTQSLSAVVVGKYPGLGFVGKLLQSQVPQYDPQVVDVDKVNDKK